MVAAQIANLDVGRNWSESNSANLQNKESKVSRKQAADMLNVSERSVNTAKKVQKDATPELTEKVVQGAPSCSLVGHTYTEGAPLAPIREIHHSTVAAIMQGYTGIQRSKRQHQ